MRLTFAVLVLLASAVAQEAHHKAAFWGSVAAVSAVTAWDAHTTLQSGFTEQWTPWLYGAHPRPARTLTAMAGEVALASLLSWQLRKHHSRLWLVPLGYVGTIHTRGAIHNTFQ